MNHINQFKQTTSAYFTQLLLKAMFILAFVNFFASEKLPILLSPQHFLLYGIISIGMVEHHIDYIKTSIFQFKHAISITATLCLPLNKNKPYICPYLSLLNNLNVRKKITSHLILCFYSDMTSPYLNKSLHNSVGPFFL